jgi:hypothetical protein
VIQGQIVQAQSAALRESLVVVALRTTFGVGLAEAAPGDGIDGLTVNLRNFFTNAIVQTTQTTKGNFKDKGKGSGLAASSGQVGGGRTLRRHRPGTRCESNGSPQRSARGDASSRAVSSSRILRRPAAVLPPLQRVMISYSSLWSPWRPWTVTLRWIRRCRISSPSASSWR